MILVHTRKVFSFGELNKRSRLSHAVCRRHRFHHIFHHSSSCGGGGGAAAVDVQFGAKASGTDTGRAIKQTGSEGFECFEDAAFAGTGMAWPGPYINNYDGQNPLGIQPNGQRAFSQ